MKCAVHAIAGSQKPYSERAATMVVDGYSMCDDCGIATMIQLSENPDQSAIDVVSEALGRGFV